MSEHLSALQKQAGAAAKTGLSVLLGLLVAALLVAACGAQPEPAAQSSQPATTQTEEPGGAETHDDSDRQADVIELSAVNLAGGEKLNVVATTNIVGDLVHHVGGNMIDLTTMLPVGADPHTFAPTPQDAASVADAHLIFMNGLHLEEFLDKLIENAGGQAAVVVISTDIEARAFAELEDHRKDKESDEDGHSSLEEADPHVWMSPLNVLVMVHNIENALSEADPSNADTYGANAQVFKAQLEALDGWVKSQIDTIPLEKRKMVTDHDSFGYYADRYGLEIVGAVIPAYSSNAEPSAQELAQLQKAIEKFDAKAIFVGTTVNPILAQRLADDSNIKLVPLYTGSLDEAGSGVESYLDFIRYNTSAIVEALK